MFAKNDIINNIIELKFTEKGYHIISNSDDIIYMAKLAINNGGNFIFEKSYLFSLFIAELKYNSLDIKLINCNASPDRLNEDLLSINNDEELIIYYNIGKCKNIDILSNILNKTTIICL